MGIPNRQIGQPSSTEATLLHNILKQLNRLTEVIFASGGGGGGTGDVTGPGSAVNTNIATFSGTSGKIIQDSGSKVSDLQAVSGKDATGGYAGLTLFKINFKNAANTITSFFTNTNTVARTYTFQNRDGTIADDTDLALKLAILNAVVALTDSSSIDLTATKHTLSSSSATRTFTISFTGDDITIELTLSTTSTVYTFPATSLCVSDGVASGDNTLTLTGVSGDKYIIGIKKIGSNYYVISKNFGQ